MIISGTRSSAAVSCDYVTGMMLNHAAQSMGARFSSIVALLVLPANACAVKEAPGAVGTTSRAKQFFFWFGGRFAADAHVRMDSLIVAHLCSRGLNQPRRPNAARARLW